MASVRDGDSAKRWGMAVRIWRDGSPVTYCFGRVYVLFVASEGRWDEKNREGADFCA